MTALAQTAPPDSLRDLVREHEDIEREERRRRVEEAIRFYTPHAKQCEFHEHLARVRVFQGGNRSGKTTAALAECVAHFLGYRPWLPEAHPFRVVTVEDGRGGRRPIKRASLGVLIGESFGTIEKVHLRKLLGDPEKGEPGLIPKAEVTSTKKNQQGTIVWINGAHGNRIHLMSYDQPPELFESIDMDYAAFDEPPPRTCYISLRRGLMDRLGPCWLAMTPLKEPWVYDEIIAKPETHTVVVNTRDNIGFGMTEQAVADYERDLDPDEKEARIKGNFIHLSGLVYKQYSKDAHWLKRASNPLQVDWGYYMHVDPHYRKPHRAVWVAVRPDDVKIVIGELESRGNHLIREFAEDILQFEAEFLHLDSDDLVRIIDPLAKTPNPTGDGRDIATEFRDCGLSFKAGSKLRGAAIQLLRQALAFDKDRGKAPMIYFFDDLVGVHHEMTHYIYDEYTGKDAREKRDQKQEPRKKYDDYIEGIHRILLEDPHAPLYEEPDESRGYESDSLQVGY